MPRFISELTFTPASAQGFINNPHDRAETIGPLMESLGGKLIDYYFTVGNGTVFVIYELPDADAVQAVSLRVVADGVVSDFKTQRVLTSAEAVEGMKKAAAINYNTPAS